MSERLPHWPGSFDEFRSHQTRALDRLAVDSLLREVERHAGDVPPERGGMTEPLARGGDRTVLS
jgi:membrane protein required for beta-lactamase induction